MRGWLAGEEALVSVTNVIRDKHVPREWGPLGTAGCFQLGFLGLGSGQKDQPSWLLWPQPLGSDVSELSRLSLEDIPSYQVKMHPLLEIFGDWAGRPATSIPKPVQRDSPLLTLDPVSLIINTFAYLKQVTFSSLQTFLKQSDQIHLVTYKTNEHP